MEYPFDMKQISILMITVLFLTGCASKDDSDNSSEFGGGTYIGCVLELTEARNAGIISATDSEIRSECSASTLP